MNHLGQQSFDLFATHPAPPPPPAPRHEPSAYDICAHRHGGNPQSQTAFRHHHGAFSKQRAGVLAAIRAADPRHGLTCKELAALWAVGMNTLSGRFSELKLNADIVPARDAAGRPLRRDGCAAYKASEFPS